MTWKTGSCVLGLAILAALAYDVNIHGSFEKSNTGQVLKDTGALRYGNLVWEQTKVACDKSTKWAVVNVPIYYNATCVYLDPYLELARDLSLVAYNSGCRVWHDASHYVTTKAPVVEQWVHETTPIVKETLNSALVTTKRYATIAKDHTLYYTESAITYAKKNIFVGSMSPENLQKYTMEALNTTQQLASNTFHWVVEKYHSLSRIHQ